MEIVARTFKQLWQSTSGFMLWNLGDHKVLFVFDNSTDIDRIIHSDPSSFNKQLVVLERYDKDILLCDLKFAKANFWVQVHEIPVRFIMTEVAESLYETNGKSDDPLKRPLRRVEVLFRFWLLLVCHFPFPKGGWCL